MTSVCMTGSRIWTPLIRKTQHSQLVFIQH